MSKKEPKNITKADSEESSKRKIQIKQSDVPALPQEAALRVPSAIYAHYAGKPVTPFQLAKALNISTTSSHFRTLCGASSAYGLTEGGYASDSIAPTEIARRIIKPTSEGEDSKARCESVLRPRVLNEFLTRYNEAQLPRHDIALNVLEELGVPPERTESVYQLIIESANTVGLIQEINGKKYVELNDVNGVGRTHEEDAAVDSLRKDESNTDDGPLEELPAQRAEQNGEKIIDTIRSRRVFITHGKNKDFIEPIKKLLGFGEMVPVVSVDKQSVSKPVPDKVMDDMRSCGAAIIHVTDETRLIDQDANERVIVNENVLIEIGAAMALYGRRFILLVKSGVTLPSNLQGLYEVRYKDEKLDGDATIRLLEAINDIKNNPLP